VYVTNANGNTVSVINGATRTVTATIPVGNAPNGVAVNPATGTVYVTNANGNTVSVINGATSTVTTTIPVGPSPAGVAVEPGAGTAGTVYVADEGDHTVSVINGATNTVTTAIAVGNAPNGVAVNPATSAGYVTNGGNSVSVLGATAPACGAAIPRAVQFVPLRPAMAHNRRSAAGSQFPEFLVRAATAR
jgi:YVTN family beta-propeller protein